MFNAIPQQALKTFGWLGVWGLSCMCFVAGCGTSEESAEQTRKKYEVADEDQPGGSSLAGGDAGSRKTGAPTQPPSLSFDEPEAITVPDGTPAELLEFANQIGEKINAFRVETGGRIQGAAKTREVELFRAIIAASDKVLSIPQATRDERKAAIENKAGSMSWLSQLEPEKDSRARVREFCVKLASDNDPHIAVIGKSILFGVDLGEFSQGPTRDVDELMRKLKALLQDEARGDVVMGVAIQAMNVLGQLEFETQARETIDLIVAAFKDSNDPSLVQETTNLTEEALFLDTRIQLKFNDAVANRPGAEEAFVQELANILAQPTPGSVTLEKGARYIGILQRTGQHDLARKLCQMYQETYAKNTDANLKEGAEQLVQMALRRLDLIGKPLVIEGRRLDGISLDFSQYQGKHVLVIFFAVISPDCQRELMNIQNAYQKFHDRGFDVIGVSVDPDPQILGQFLQQAALPWATVTNNELAKQCGADLVPFSILLDPAGKVTDIFLEKQALHTKLESLLGAASGAAPAAPPVPNPGGEQSRRAPLRGSLFVAAGFATAGMLEVAAEDTSTAQGDAAAPTAQDSQEQAEVPEEQREGKAEEADETANPYLARPGLSPSELINFLFDMQDKPKSIRLRPGFTAAMVEAADRVLRSDAEARFQLIATETKLDVLHEAACLGDEASDQQLQRFVGELAHDQRPEIARRIKFLLLERRLLEADQLDLQEIPPLLADVQRFCEAESVLGNRHLRLASAAVHAVNRLEEAGEREKYFTELGNLFAKGDDPQLARYGKKLAQGGKGRASDLIGKPVELAGMTDLGIALDWSSYRGKVVLVDFWATWCGPCLREAPQVRALYDELSSSGFDVVAISLDEDLEALAKFLQEHKVPWVNLVGEEARALATKYEVRGIPTMLLVDKEGKVVAVSNKLETLRPEVQKLLGGS